MTMTHVRFEPTRKLTEYIGQPGEEIGGQRLTPAAYEAISDAKRTGKPSELVVTGEYIRSDGARFLTFGVTREHIEAVSDFRHHLGRLHYLCPDCGLWDGRHSKVCGNG